MVLLTDLQSNFKGNQWPEFMAATVEEQSISLQINISEGVHWFKGHFDSQPVLPGVAQVHWAGELGKFLLPEVGESFAQLSNVKFHSVILPNNTVTLLFNRTKKGFAFRFFQGNTIFSDGKFEFLQGDQIS